MKRLISVVLVLLTLGVAAFFFFKVGRVLTERPRASELAPPETIFFAQIPNIRQTAFRGLQSDLYQIWREDDVQAFLEKPRLKAPWMQEWTKWMDEALHAAPAEVFLAVTSLEGPRPSFVGGFSYVGSRRQAETLVDHIVAKVIPSATKAEARTPDGVHIETLTHPGGELVTRFHENWFFFASDTALLTSVLQRFDAKGGASLSTDPAFKKTPAGLGGAYDLVFYGKPGRLTGSFIDKILPKGTAKPDPDSVFAMGTKIEQGKLHDTIFLSGDHLRKPKPLTRETLALAPAQTLLYYATDLPHLDALPGEGMVQRFFPAVAAAELRLAAQGLKWGMLPEAVGPELGTILEWPEEAALPQIFTALPTRDAAKARQFADALTAQGVEGTAWPLEETPEATLFRVPVQGFSLVHPVLALNSRFTLMGTTPESISAALPRMKDAKSKLSDSPVFQDVIRFVPPQATTIAYLDFRRLFERVYRMARPFITLSIAFNAEAGTQFDTGKLPPVDAISKHLSAIVLSEVRTEEGLTLDSYGSITLPSLMIGAFSAAASVPSSALPAGLKQMVPGGGLRLPGAAPMVPVPPLPDVPEPSPAPQLPQSPAETTPKPPASEN